MRQDVAAAREHYASLGLAAGTYLFLSVDRILGLLAYTIGDLDQAEAHFEEALLFCRKAGYLPELAWTCHDHAESLLKRNRPRDREKAVSLIEESLRISTELGMTPLLERATALKEMAGSGRRIEADNPSGLTQREVEVLTHLAQGKTNREIARELVLSERTVQRHIYNIYIKIKVRNRAEATTFALSQLPT